MKVIMYIIGIYLAIFGIAFMTNGSIIGGLLVLLVGLAIIPPIEENLLKNLTFWNKAFIRRSLLIALTFVGFLTSINSIDFKTINKNGEKTSKTEADFEVITNQIYSENKNDEKTSKPKVDFKVTAKHIYSEYEANEVAADEKYKNKKIAVTGVIESINKDFFDNPYISLEVNIFKYVICYFSDGNNKIISKLSKGQTVTIIGIGDGFSVSAVKIINSELMMRNK